jgi:hypothetical protein
MYILQIVYHNLILYLHLSTVPKQMVTCDAQLSYLPILHTTIWWIPTTPTSAILLQEDVIIVE